MQIRVGIVWQVDNVGVQFINPIAFGKNIHQGSVIAHHVGEGPAIPVFFVLGKFVAEAVAGIGHGAAGMFLFGVAHQIGGETDLCFYFLFAIAVIVIGDQGNHDAGGTAAT